MEDKYENGIRYLLICLIIIGAVTFLMFALDINIGRNIDSNDLLAPKNQVGMIAENKTKIVKKRESNEVEEEYRVDEIMATVEPNIDYVLKYIDEGIVKTQISKEDRRNEYKSKIIYNYNLNSDLLEITYPASWIPSIYAMEEYLTVTYCHDENDTRTFGTGLVGAVINEIDVSNYENVNNENALEILESKLIEYVNQKSEIYFVDNFETEEISTDENYYKILKYEYNQGKYYKTICYSTALVSGDYAYVLTFTIPNEDMTEENINLKDEIIKSFKFSNKE